MVEWKGAALVKVPVYFIDGRNFNTLGGFYHEVGRVLLSEPRWTGNLDAFDDILSWPCFEAGGPYLLVWQYSALSKQHLGHEQMTQKLETMLQNCHAANTPEPTERLEQAKQGQGPTLFDWLVEIMEENQDYLTLRLECLELQSPA
jgi:Barstar (barnase inhibitor)